MSVRAPGPNMQTVFLTRATAPILSEILPRQMIRRAMRCAAAGGTREAFLVSFEDHWAQSREWARPTDLVPEIEDAAEKPHGALPPALAPKRSSPIPTALERAMPTLIPSRGA